MYETRSIALRGCRLDNPLQGKTITHRMQRMVHNANVLETTCLHRSSGRVRNVMQPVHGLQNALALILFDVGFAIDDTRNRLC